MSNISDYLEYKPIIQARSEEIATQWFHTLRRNGNLPTSSVAVSDSFTKLVSRSIDILFSTPFDQKGAQVIGATMGELKYFGSRVLGDTQELFANELTTNLPVDVAKALYPQLLKLIAEIAVGFSLTTEHSNLEVQENLRTSVTNALNASEERFRALAELVPVAIFIYQDDKLLYINKYFKVLTNYTDEDLAQLTIWDIIHPHHRQMVRAREAAVESGGVLPTSYEIKALKKDQTDLWVELNFSEIQYDDKNAVLGTAFDITSRMNNALEREKLLKNTQLEIQERINIEKQLKDNQTRYMALLTAIPDLMFRLSADGYFLDFHASVAEKLYTSPDEFLGRNISEVMPMPVAEKIVGAIKKALDTNEMVTINYNLILEDGTTSIFEARLVPSGNSEVVSTVRDITTHRQAEQRVIKSERLAALGQLAASLAHEMNNPLQAILSNLDLISDFKLNKDDLNTQVEIIHHEVERLIGISQRMLNFANLKPEIRHIISPTEVMDYTLGLLKKQIEQNQAEINVTYAKNIPSVMAAFNQLHQVFLNTLLNAYEALYAQEGNRCIDISIVPSGKNIEISISNNGEHISDDIMARLFEPFFTTKSDNTGLGLWTSYTFIKQHDGDFKVENIFGAEPGVKFTISLPAYHPKKDR